jgi:hypothetical protein
MAAVAVAVSLAASAADVASRMTGDYERWMDDEAAACIIGKNPELIAAWLGTLPGSSAELKVLSGRDARFARCFGGRAGGDWMSHYNYAAMRVRLVRYLLQNRIVAVPATRPAGLDTPGWFVGSGRIPGPRESIIANDLGFCLAKSNWPAARSVVLSDRGSRAEAAALRRLVPLIGGCIPPRAKLRVDMERLRAVIEETAYHAAGGASVAALAAVTPAQPGSR